MTPAERLTLGGPTTASSKLTARLAGGGSCGSCNGPGVPDTFWGSGLCGWSRWAFTWCRGAVDAREDALAGGESARRECLEKVLGDNARRECSERVLGESARRECSEGVLEGSARRKCLAGHSSIPPGPVARGCWKRLGLRAFPQKQQRVWGRVEPTRSWVGVPTGRRKCLESTVQRETEGQPG